VGTEYQANTVLGAFAKSINGKAHIFFKENPEFGSWNSLVPSLSFNQWV
jgi:hypothetical protein